MPHPLFDSYKWSLIWGASVGVRRRKRAKNQQRIGHEKAATGLSSATALTHHSWGNATENAAPAGAGFGQSLFAAAGGALPGIDRKDVITRGLGHLPPNLQIPDHQVFRYRPRLFRMGFASGLD
jgi:hypothetical protein